jgi:uncharacterized membrane protein YfcA
MEIVGYFIVFFIGFLATAGGLGGGSILTPFLMIFLKLSIFECMPIANFVGLLSGSTRFAINYHITHPNPIQAKQGKLVIEYEVVTLTMPMLYLGTLVGVQVGTMLGEVQLATILVLLICFTFYKTVKKVFELRNREINNALT